MPAFNAEMYIRAAIESILDQSLRDIELIIVNDGSTDGTWSICQKLAALDQRVAILTQNNQGIAATLNSGIKSARAPLIARMDADDVAFPIRMERQVSHLARHPDIALVSAAFLPFTDASASVQAPVTLPTDHLSIYATLAFCSPVCHPAVMARRELFEAFPYRSGIAAEDHDLWCRAIHQFRFSNLAEPLLYYRRHTQSLSARKARLLKASTLRSGSMHILRDIVTYRSACEECLEIDRSLYPEINWRWMDRINALLGIRRQC